MTRQEIFEYCREKYGAEPEYPGEGWNAVLRHTDTKKQYAVIMEVSYDKLGISGDGDVDIVNLKCDSSLIKSLRSQAGYLPAYHMDEDNWVSILLDGTVSEVNIKSLLDLSYRLTNVCS